MKNLIFCMALALVLAGCGDKKEPPVVAAPPKQPTADLAAGKVIAERDCKACHGLDGGGVAPGIPRLAGQRERYLAASLNEYKEGKRSHAALRNMTANMSEADLRNVASYFASLPPVATAGAVEVKHSSPYEQGKTLAAACVKCHGADGNSQIPGTPTLAGQQPHYLVAAIQEYHQGDRAKGAMKSGVRNTDKLELESVALYFAAQTPVKRQAPARGDPTAGEPLTATCGGCHGYRGVSADAATPTLAGQDAGYLVKAIKSYRTTRKNWGMQRYVAGMDDKNIENIAAYYVSQEPRAADQVPASTQELAAKCNRCHDQEDNAAMTAPRMKGQDMDYLVMALRAYRDGRRESSTMHNMSTIYSNAIIQSLAAWYSSQPPK